MFSFFSKFFSKSPKKNIKSHPNHDMEMAFRLHGMVSAMNNSSSEDKLKSLETLRTQGFIEEVEYINAKKTLSVDTTL